eukprot:scaffold310_cov302-Prasinococcus_capsulatus_cf.AAC.6
MPWLRARAPAPFPSERLRGMRPWRVRLLVAGLDRVQEPAVRAGHGAVRPTGHDGEEPEHPSIREAGLHLGRVRREPAAALPALHQGHRGLLRPAAQRVP